LKRERLFRASGDPARRLSLYLQRAMTSRLGMVLPFAFRLEVSPEGRLHAHGVLIPSANGQAEIGLVLRQAGGRLKGRYTARQAKLEPIYDAAAWVSVGYLSKSIRQTSASIGSNKIDFISSGLKKIARSDWNSRLH
jgi:hypothetical protein